jgi:hypothetical protein
MNTFSQDVPVSQIILDKHASVRAKVELANRAVLEAIRAMLEFDDPMAGNIFGADPELLRQLANTSKAKILPLVVTGIPIFSVRLATPDFKSVLDGNESGDAALQSLLRTFQNPPPLSSLG